MSSRILRAAFSIRLLISAIACFLPFSEPHVWRQTDTLGIAASYFNRFNFEQTTANFWFRLIPAALNSSDNYGYVATEFPFLNLTVSPVFWFGENWGQILSRLLLLFLLSGIVVLIAKKPEVKFNNGIRFGDVALFFPLMSSGAIYFGKFIPDCLATLLVFLSVVLSWRKPRSVLSFVLCSLGLLIKPTSVVVLGLLFFRIGRLLRKFNFWVFGSLLVAALYYLLIIPVLIEVQDSPFPFDVKSGDIIQNLIDFGSDFKSLKYVFGRFMFTEVGLALLGIGYCFFWKSFSRVHLQLWGLLVIQFIVIGMLDGAHSFGHTYYFLGLQPTASLIALEFLAVMKSSSKSTVLKPVTYVLFGLVLLVGLIQQTREEFQLFRPTNNFLNGFSGSCQSLKKRNPHFPWRSGYAFRSPFEQFPELGLCFGERSASQNANFGFFSSSVIPADCKVVDQDGELRLVVCDHRS